MTGHDEIECASLTDVGIRRSHNQDAHVAVPAADADGWRQRGHVLLVADGMGAHAVGELASKIAVDTVPHVYAKHAAHGPEAALRRAFVEANQAIHTRGQQNKEFAGMGTTGTALVLRPEGAWVGHVGDSRAYRVRGGVIEQLSFDHSLLWELARRQGKSPDELHGIPSNVIVRSLGPEPAVEVDVEGPHPLRPGDIYLLCSDGLSGQVTDRELGAVAAALPADEACRFLVHLANLHGGPDNITVLVARLRGAPAAPAPDSQANILFPSSDTLRLTPPGWAARARGRLGGVPWGLALMVTGIGLAGAAIALTSLQLPGGLPAFFLAGVALIGGLVGVVLQNRREQAREQAAAAARPLQVYRQAPCAVDDGLVGRLAQAAASLAEEVRQKGWPFDAARFQQHAKLAEQYRAAGPPVEAFREQCRAMLVLMEAVHQQRGRGESFNPRWQGPAM